MVSGVASLVASVSFSPALGCSTNFEGLLGGGGTSSELCFSGSATSKGVTGLELLEVETRMARG